MSQVEVETAVQEITVTCGANSGSYPLVGKTVAEVRTFLSDIMNIPPKASPLVGGKKAKETRKLHAGEQVEFVVPSSRNG